jgi:hypothetical protein
VVDADETPRKALLLALHQLGLKAVGVDRVVEAVSLLAALDADLTLVRSDDDERTLAPLRARLPLIKLDPDAGVDVAIVELLRALGRPEEAAQIN